MLWISVRAKAVQALGFTGIVRTGDDDFVAFPCLIVRIRAARQFAELALGGYGRTVDGDVDTLGDGDRLLPYETSIGSFYQM